VGASPVAYLAFKGMSLAILVTLQPMNQHQRVKKKIPETSKVHDRMLQAGLIKVTYEKGCWYVAYAYAILCLSSANKDSSFVVTGLCKG
jgi:hypothetical protein